jgi:hypothetical protein
MDMSDFWNRIPNNIKVDLTNIGHHSGTGLVWFNYQIYFQA